MGDGVVGDANPLLMGSLPSSSILDGREALLTLRASSRLISPAPIAAPKAWFVTVARVAQLALVKCVGVGGCGPTPKARGRECSNDAHSDSRDTPMC